MAHLKLILAAIVVVVASSVAGHPVGFERHPFHQDEYNRPIIIVDPKSEMEMFQKIQPSASVNREIFVEPPTEREVFHRFQPSASENHETIYAPRTSASNNRDTIYVPQTSASENRDIIYEPVPSASNSYGPPAHEPAYKPAPTYKKKYTPGKVGPVYTFAKTDYHGNFKWGVRHRAGSQYAGSHH